MPKPPAPEPFASEPFVDLVNPPKPQTRVYSLAHIDAEPDRVVELIQTMWRVAGDGKSGEIVLHDKTSLLIIKAPSARLTEAEQVLETFAEQQQLKLANSQASFERKLGQLEHDAALRMDKLDMELQNQRAINNELEKQLSELRSQGRSAD